MSEEYRDSQVFTATTNSWWDSPPRRKTTSRSVYLRVDEIDGEWQVIVCGDKAKGPNLSYDHGYVEGFLIKSTGKYALMNYVNETGREYCYLAFHPLSGGTRTIKFCWSPGASTTYPHPAIVGIRSTDDYADSQIYDIRQDTWFDTDIRSKSTSTSVYLRVDEIDGEWKVVVMSDGQNLSYDHGYVDHFIICKTGQYALKNYVQEKGHNNCYLALFPKNGTHHIRFCWSSGSSRQYPNPVSVPIGGETHQITGDATAYCDGGYAADGTKTGPGCIAVDPKRIPYGTRLHVTWNGGSYDGVAHDTGGACQSGAIVVDLWFHTERECNNFGRRKVTVYY